MSIESAIEEMIKQAIARGEFDNLEGKGKPLNLDAYFATPEDVRMGFSVLKSNDFVPEEVEMFKEIADLREQIKNCTSSERKNELNKILNARSLHLSLILERNKRRK